MENWQWGLALLVVAWALQAAGTWRQTRHYREVMGDIARRWPDGWLGVGNARGGLRKGVVAIVVATRDDAIRRVLLMEGRSVFAKFVALDGADGLPVAQLSSLGAISAQAARKTAVDMAVEQIAKAKTKARVAQSGTAEIPEDALADAERMPVPPFGMADGGALKDKRSRSGPVAPEGAHLPNPRATIVGQG